MIPHAPFYPAIPIEFIVTEGRLGGAYLGVTLFVFCFHRKMDYDQLLNLLRCELRRFPYLASLVISTLQKILPLQHSSPTK